MSSFSIGTRAQPRQTTFPTQGPVPLTSIDVSNTVSTNINNTVSVTFSGTISSSGVFNASGFVTTAPPTYTDSTTQALSLTTAGELRTIVSGLSVTGVFNASGFVTTAAPTYTNSTTQALSLTTAGDLRTTVSGIANTVSVTGTFWPTTQTVSGTVSITGTITATIPNPTTVSGTVTAVVPNPTTVSGTVTVSTITGALPTGSNVIGHVVVDGTITASIPNPTTVSGTVSAQFLAASTGGYTPSTSTALSTAAFTVTTSAGTLGGWFIGNPNTGSFAYVQIFDASTVTVGTTAPTLILSIPAGAAANLQPFIAFTTAIKVAASTTPTGSASLTSALVASFWYK